MTDDTLDYEVNKVNYNNVVKSFYSIKADCNSLN